MSYSTIWLDGRYTGDVAVGATLLKRGEPVVFPTDTVYGVGTSAFSEEGIGKIYRAKVRDAEKGIPILLADLADLEQVADDFPQMAWELAEQFWPGALTLIVPKHPSLPKNISPNSGIAVRLPNHELCRDLIRQAGGAVAATSANLSGQPAALSAESAAEQLDGRVEAIINGGPVTAGLPSTIVSLLGQKPVIVRQGPVKLDNGC